MQNKALGPECLTHIHTTRVDVLFFFLRMPKQPFFFFFKYFHTHTQTKKKKPIVYPFQWLLLLLFF